MIYLHTKYEVPRLTHYKNKEESQTDPSLFLYDPSLRHAQLRVNF